MSNAEFLDEDDVLQKSRNVIELTLHCKTWIMGMVEKMNDRTYDLLANVLMLVALTSAIMFDAGFLPHIVVGTIGGIAALGSACLYFGNHS